MHELENKSGIATGINPLWFLALACERRGEVWKSRLKKSLESFKHIWSQYSERTENKNKNPNRKAVLMTFLGDNIELDCKWFGQHYGKDSGYILPESRESD